MATQHGSRQRVPDGKPRSEGVGAAPPAPSTTPSTQGSLAQLIGAFPIDGPPATTRSVAALVADVARASSAAYGASPRKPIELLMSDAPKAPFILDTSAVLSDLRDTFDAHATLAARYGSGEPPAAGSPGWTPSDSYTELTKKFALMVLGEDVVSAMNTAFALDAALVFTDPTFHRLAVNLARAIDRRQPTAGQPRVTQSMPVMELATSATASRLRSIVKRVDGGRVIVIDDTGWSSDSAAHNITRELPTVECFRVTTVSKDGLERSRPTPLPSSEDLERFAELLAAHVVQVDALPQLSTLGLGITL